METPQTNEIELFREALLKLQQNHDNVQVTERHDNQNAQTPRATSPVSPASSVASSTDSECGETTWSDLAAKLMSTANDVSDPEKQLQRVTLAAIVTTLR